MSERIEIVEPSEREAPEDRVERLAYEAESRQSGTIQGNGKIRYFEGVGHYDPKEHPGLAAFFRDFGPVKVGAWFDVTCSQFAPHVSVYDRVEANQFESIAHTQEEAQKRADEIYADLKERGFPVERIGKA